MTAATVPLRYAAKVLVSNVDKKSVVGDAPVRLVNYTDVYYRSEITSDLAFMTATATPEQVRKFGVQPGDSIITKDSETPDDIAVPTFVLDADDDMVCGYHLAMLRPSGRVAPKYLYWALCSDFLGEQFSVRANGMTRYGLTYEAIQGVEVPLPALEEQRRIADFLDDQVGRIDAVVAQQQRRLELLNELQEARTARLVDKAGSPQRLSRLLDMASVGVVVNPSDYFADEGVPFIHGSNVREGFFDLEGVKLIEPSASDSLPRSRLREGDVVVVRAGYPGRAAVVPAALEGANCASVLLLRPARRLRSAWLTAFLNSRHGKDQVVAVQYGAAQEQINLSHALDFRVPLPSLDEQDALIRQIHKEVDAVRGMRHALERQVGLLTEYKRSLITAAVTGELDVATARPAVLA